MRKTGSQKLRDEALRIKRQETHTHHAARLTCQFVVDIQLGRAEVQVEAPGQRVGGAAAAARDHAAACGARARRGVYVVDTAHPR